MSQFYKAPSVAPVNLIHLERASFADLHDIGLEKLAVTDVTVVDELDMNGYSKLVDYAQKKFKGLLVSESESARLRIFSHPTFRILEQQYLSLTRLEFGRFRLNAETGMSPDVQKHEKTTGAPHIDSASRRLAGAITLNATLFTEGEWYWGLSGETMHKSDEVIRSVVPEVVVPLRALGIVILGEHARQDSFGDPCTVVHEVLSPEESWGSPVVQRVRSLHYRQ